MCIRDSGKLLPAKFLAQRLRPVYGQTVVHRVPWVKADNIVVAFYIFPLLVIPIAEIGAHTGNGKIRVAAVQRGYSIVLPEHEPPVFVKGGLHGKLVMFKGEVLLGCEMCIRDRCQTMRTGRHRVFACCFTWRLICATRELHGRRKSPNTGMRLLEDVYKRQCIHDGSAGTVAGSDALGG